MVKKSKELKRLVFLQSLRVPRYTKKDYDSDEALKFNVDWKLQTEENRSIFYVGNDGNKYKIESYFVSKEKDIAELMLMEGAEVGVLSDREIYYERYIPKVYTSLKIPEIEIEKIVLEQGKNKIVKDLEGHLIRIRKVGRLK